MIFFLSLLEGWIGEKAIAVWGQYMTRVLAFSGRRREEGALLRALTLGLALNFGVGIDICSCGK